LKRFIFAVVLCSVSLTPSANAQSRPATLLGSARSLIEDLNADSAFALIQVALDPRIAATRPERIRGLTLLGIAELMRGNRVAGRLAFEQALRLDGNLRIDSLTDLASDAAVVFSDARAALGPVPTTEKPNIIVSGGLVRLGIPYDALSVWAGTLRYRISLSDLPFGELVQTNQHSRDGTTDFWRLLSVARQQGSARQFSQDDTTTIDALTFEPFRSRRAGMERGSPTSVALDYREGRVRGETRSRSGSELRGTLIDTTISRGVVDESSLMTVLGVLRYSPGARFLVPVFQTSTGTEIIDTVAVVGEESISTSAGTFLTWKVTVSSMTIFGYRYPAVLNVTREYPVVARIRFVGLPLAMELARRN
jgi:hypothetical protein